MFKIKKTSLTFILLLTFAIVKAQYKEGKIILKDSTSIDGLIQLNVNNGIDFKSNKNSKEVEYDYDDIIGFDLKYKKYIYLKYNQELRPRLLEERIKGKITLFNNEVYTIASMQPMGVGSGGISRAAGSYSVYFIKAGDKLIKIGDKIRKRHLEIFSDCPELIQKIDEKELNKKEVYKIVAFYNEKCG